jgi:FO synthase subunit 1
MEKNIITFSKNIFIPLTDACRNNCAYCSFRSDKPSIMSRDEVVFLLKRGVRAGCKEALFTFGENPSVYPEIKEKLEYWGYSTVVEYLYDLCLDATELDLLPHSNPGSVKMGDLKLLKDVNASMGLMLESSSERLCNKGLPHEKSPGKKPRVRRRVIEEAGRLGIPFTTGILIGIGETDQEVRDSINLLRKIQDRYGHLQELIIQNFRPKLRTPMANFPEPPLSRLINGLEFAKRVFPTEGLQIPPNLNPGREGVFIKHGANDFGGVSPITDDFVNPLDKWPTEGRLRHIANKNGVVLRERLPVYPGFFGRVSERLRSIIDLYVDKEGLVNDRS